MSLRLASLPSLLAALVLVLTACAGTSTASPSPRPSETEAQEPEAQETEAEETEAAETEPEETEAQETEQARTEAPEGDGGEAGGFSFDALLTRIPENVVENCEAYADNDDLLITAECEMPEGSDADYVEYTVAVNADEMYELYEGIIAVMGVTASDTGVCPEEVPSEESYNIGDEEVGRLACAVSEDGAAAIAWTDERLLIVAFANRQDGDLATLHEWWGGPDSGPVQ